MPLLKKKLAKNLMKKEEEGRSIPEIKQEYSEISTDFGNKSQASLLEAIKKEQTVSDYKPKASLRVKVELDAKKKANSSKNIVKNYARTMVTFAISKMAYPYIKAKLHAEKLEHDVFKEFLASKKENMDGISSLRRILLILDEDDNTMRSIKRVFAFCSEIFLKFFSVNWIFNSKLGDKISYVKSRFKLLRRIRDPEHFTYFKL